MLGKSCGFMTFFFDFGVILGVQGNPLWAQNLKKMHLKFDWNFDDFLGPSEECNAGGSEPPREPLWHLETRFLGARLLEG